MKKNNSIIFVLLASLIVCFVSPIVVIAAGPAVVNLGSAGNFVILSKTGISTTGATSIIGDIGVSPAEATYITGFGLILPALNAYSTSSLVTGKVYAPGYAVPTPANLTTAVSNMETAYTDGAGRTNPTATELGAGNIGGMTLAPGLYKWGTGVTIPTDVTLSGNTNDIWIFQIAQNLNISSATKIILSGGAKASNVFWIVAGQTTIGTTAVFNGNILDQTAIILNTGATLNGRALAQTAVTLDSNVVTVQAIYNPVVPVVVVVPLVNTTVSGTSNTSENLLENQTLTSQQQQSYNQLISLGVNPSIALNAINLITPTTSVSGISTSASYFGQQVGLINANLGEGVRNNDVKTLQEFLIAENKGPAAQALTSHGTTTYFGFLTKLALVEFQKSVGINPSVGYFGPTTRAYINAH